MLRTLFVQGSLINYDWSICHIDAINQIIPRPVHPSCRAHTLLRLLIFYLLWQLQSKHSAWLLTQQTAQWWSQHSTATGYRSPVSGLWLVSIPEYWSPIGWCPGVTGWQWLCILLCLWLRIIGGLSLVSWEHQWPLICQLWAVTASDWSGLSCAEPWLVDGDLGPALMGHCVLITSHWTC